MIILYSILYSKTKRTTENLPVAKELDHMVAVPYDPNLRFHAFDDLISTVYNARYPEDVDVDKKAEKTLG